MDYWYTPLTIGTTLCYCNSSAGWPMVDCRTYKGTLSKTWLVRPCPHTAFVILIRAVYIVEPSVLFTSDIGADLAYFIWGTEGRDIRVFSLLYNQACLAYVARTYQSYGVRWDIWPFSLRGKGENTPYPYFSRLPIPTLSNIAVLSFQDLDTQQPPKISVTAGDT